MGFVKKNWLLILIVIVLVILLYRYYNKTKQNATTLEKTQNVFSHVVSTLTPKPVLTSPDNEPVNSNANQTGNSGTTQYIPTIGCELFANDNIVNAYSIPDARTPSKYYFKKDKLIGTYLGFIQSPGSLENFFKVNINQGLFSGYGSYYVLVPQVYTLSNCTRIPK